MGQLQNKVAVITGGARGLGLGIARAYAAEGAAVVLAGRSAASLNSAVAELQAAGARAAGAACDVADRAQVEALADLAVSTFGGIDIWVNNAGLSAPYGPTASIPADTFQSVIDTNITGVFNGSTAALRRMLPRRSGKIINMLGRGDDKSVPLQNAYSSSKVWVRNFTLALAQEYKDSGVGIFAFNPGLVDTDMIRRVAAVQGFEGRLKPLETVIRLWGNPPAVPAAKAVWLASSATDGRTGLAVTMLSPDKVIGGLLRDLARRALGRPAPDTSLDVTSVAPPAG